MPKSSVAEPRVEVKNDKLGKLHEVKRKMTALNLQRVKVAGFDVDGVLRGKYVSLDKFESMVLDGFGFCDVIFGWDSSDVLYDNAKVTGWHTGYPDTPARLDLDSMRIIPWERDTALFLVDFYDREGEPHPAAPRQVLQRVVARAHALGYEPLMAAEYEFFFFRENSHTIRLKDYKNLTPLSPGMFGYSVLRTGTNAEFVHAILDAMEAYNIPLEGFHTETGPGVYECAIRYDKALLSADKAALFKCAIKELAARNGMVVTFMAKWNDELPGCGGHLHQSLLKLDTDNVNAFYDKAGPHQMSETMRHYLAGQLALMPQFMALVCPTINSYKRLIPGTWAPTTATWGVENRTTALRVIPGGAKSTRVEYRLAGADANPYLAMAASLASGLYGIENKLSLPELSKNGYEAVAAILPSSLEQSLPVLAESKAAREYLGAEFVDHFLRTRVWEIRQYHRAVTDWEKKRYFEVI